MNVFNIFFTLPEERMEEMRFLYAPGTTTRHLAVFVAAETGAAEIGITLGGGAALLIDLLLDRYLPPVPFVPESFFYLDPIFLLTFFASITLLTMCAGWVTAKIFFFLKDIEGA